MEYLGYDPYNQPDNFEDFMAMIQDMMENNPEQRSGTVGVTAFEPWWILMLAQPWNPFTVTGGDWWVRHEGEWTRSALLPMTRDAVVAMGEMWARGLIDPDLPVLTDGMGVEKFATGRAAAFSYSGYPAPLMSRVAPHFELMYPDREFHELVTFWRPFPNEDGVLYHFEAPAFWSESFIRGDLDDETVERIYEFYNFLISPEGTNLFRFGLEGVDWNMVNGQPVSTRTEPLGIDYPILNDWGWFVTWDQEFQYTDTVNFSPEVLALSNNQLNWWWDNGVSIKQYKDFANNTIVHPDAVEHHWLFWDDFIRAMATGRDAGATWDGIIETRMGMGYQRFIDTFNEIAIGLGIYP